MKDTIDLEIFVIHMGVECEGLSISQVYKQALRQGTKQAWSWQNLHS